MSISERQKKEHLKKLRDRMKALVSSYDEIGKYCNMSMVEVHDILTMKVVYNPEDVLKVETAILNIYFLRQKEILKLF